MNLSWLEMFSVKLTFSHLEDEKSLDGTWVRCQELDYMGQHGREFCIVKMIEHFMTNKKRATILFMGAMG